MAQKTIVAKVIAPDGGTLNWAVMTSENDAGVTVYTMEGDDASKEVEIETEPDGSLDFGFVVNAFPGTSWKLTLTEKGKKEALYEREGVTDSQYTGRDGGKVSFKVGLV
jgi:hypothetical protein